MLLSDLLNEIIPILAKHWQTTVTVEPLAKLESQYIVIRCQVRGDHADLPCKVIIKKWDLRGEASEFQAPRFVQMSNLSHRHARYRRSL